MKRRFNSTGRKSIAAAHVSITVVQSAEQGAVKSFDADLSGLSAIEGIPGDARIYVEPYVTGSSSIMRFAFGTIGNILIPSDRALSELDAGGRILFRIKVVDESSDVGKILAAASALRPYDESLTEDQLKSLLPVESRDLGEAIWEVDLMASPRPTLVVSHRIPGLIDRLKTDPFAQGAIVPHAIREILSCILDPERGDVTDDSDWVQDWKMWASDILGRSLDEDIDPDLVEDRVSEIVELFENKSRFVSRLDVIPDEDAPHD